MIKAIKEKLADWILEIVLILFSASATFIWGLHTTNAEQQIQIEISKIQIEVSKNKIISLEEQIESFRKENREDHKEILMELKKKV